MKYFVTALLCATIKAQASSCFPYTEVFGDRVEGSTVSSDLSYLRGPLFVEGMHIKQLQVCGEQMTFSGI
jgi:hypothetical protein